MNPPTHTTFTSYCMTITWKCGFMRTILHTIAGDENICFFFVIFVAALPNSVNIFRSFYISYVLFIALLLWLFYSPPLHTMLNIHITHSQIYTEKETENKSEFNLILSINHVLQRKKQCFTLCCVCLRVSSHELMAGLLGDIHLLWQHHEHLFGVLFWLSLICSLSIWLTHTNTCIVSTSFECMWANSP